MKVTKASDIKRSWHVVDAKDQVLGRVATEIAIKLMGKQKPYFVRNLDCGDYVIVTNAKDVVVTGKKLTQKKYYRHSGYPGGLSTETFQVMIADHPERVIEHAVKGMIPHNKLGADMLKRLRVFPTNEHPYEEKLKTKKEEAK